MQVQVTGKHRRILLLRLGHSLAPSFLWFPLLFFVVFLNQTTPDFLSHSIKPLHVQANVELGLIEDFVHAGRGFFLKALNPLMKSDLVTTTRGGRLPDFGGLANG